MFWRYCGGNLTSSSDLNDSQYLMVFSTCFWQWPQCTQCAFHSMFISRCATNLVIFYFYWWFEMVKLCLELVQCYQVARMWIPLWRIYQPPNPSSTTVILVVIYCPMSSSSMFLVWIAHSSSAVPSSSRKAFLKTARARCLQPLVRSVQLQKYMCPMSSTELTYGHFWTGPQKGRQWSSPMSSSSAFCVTKLAGIP